MCPCLLQTLKPLRLQIPNLTHLCTNKWPMHLLINNLKWPTSRPQSGSFLTSISKQANKKVSIHPCFTLPVSCWHPMPICLPACKCSFDCSYSFSHSYSISATATAAGPAITGKTGQIRGGCSTPRPCSLWWLAALFSCLLHV